MKKSWTFISLLAALAAGGASAQSTTTPPTPSTTAGTLIVNTAEITFTPENGKETTTPSNPVTTTVLPVPSFTITPNDGSTDVTKPDYTKPALTDTVKPCDKNVDFLYTLTNTGNVPNESYALTNTPDPTGAVKTPENIRFFPKSADTNNDNALSTEEINASGAITTITGVNPGQSVQFFQVYDIPCTALDSDKFGGDPTGTRKDNLDFNNDPTVPQDANNSNTTTVSRNDGTIVGPKDDSNADNKTDPANTTPNPPYTSVDPTPETIYPGGTTLPGTTTPVPNDEQQTVAPCSATSNTVTFTNTVTNTGNRPDVFDITVNPSANVTLLKLDGTPLTDTDGDGVPDVGSLAAATSTAPGGSASFLVRYTYTGCLTEKVTLEVKATSSNNTTISDTTKDVILNPGLSFGDPTPTPGGDPNPVGTPVPGEPGSPTNPVKIPEQCTAPIKTAVPMEIANVGTAPDLYNISGTTTIKLTDGTTVSATLAYYRDVNSDGKYTAGTDTALTDTNGDGIVDTGLIAPGTEIKLVAVLDVPCNAASQTITLNQVAKSPITGVTVTDPNDEIKVGQSDVKNPITKAVDVKEAKPGDTLTYTIIGKNTSNGNITKAQVCDAPPANTSFVSWSATSDQSGTVLYTNNGTTWSTAAPTTAGTKLCAAVDTNGDGNITTADVLAPGKSITVTFKVKVN